MHNRHTNIEVSRADIDIISTPTILTTEYVRRPKPSSFGTFMLSMEINKTNPLKIKLLNTLIKPYEL